MRFLFVDTVISNKSLDYIAIESPIMFLELSNHGIWPDIFAYKRLQNTQPLRLRSPIEITRHNNESVLFNRINHFKSSLPSPK